MPSLLARFAESNFWLARYMERAENLARILDVNETFAQDGGGPRTGCRSFTCTPTTPGSSRCTTPRPPTR